MSILPLPYEILEGILKLIDKPSIKSVRCANKALAEIATPHLFDKIVVVPLPLSFRGLTNLARNPTIQNSVKKIVFETHHLQHAEHNDPNYIRPPAYQRRMLDGIRYASNMEGLPVIMHDIGPPGRTKSQVQAHDKSVSRVSYYAKRNRWKIAKLVKAYPQASHFVLKGWGFETRTSTLDQEILPRLAPHFYQRWTTAPVYFWDSVFWGESKVYSEHCISTFCALSHCEGQIKVLDVDGPHWNNFMSHYNDLREDEQLAIDSFFTKSNIQSFTAGLGMYPPRHNRYDHAYHNPKTGPDGLEAIVPLTAHSLSSIHLRNYSSLSLLTWTVFPCLRQLELSYLGTTQANLESIITSHSSTLQSIKLQSITFQNHQQLPSDVPDPSTGSWVNFIRHLPQYALNLEEINLSGRLQSHNEDIFTLDSSELPSFGDSNCSNDAATPDRSKMVRAWNHYSVPEDCPVVIYDEQNCLRNRIHQYILGKGKAPFPDELQRHVGYRHRMRAVSEVSYKVEGDYSWEMLSNVTSPYN